MRLNKLSIRDKEIFEKYLSLDRRELSVYAFPNIYIWQELFEIRWAVIRDNLCIFVKDKIGCFLYLPPLGKIKTPEVIRAVFETMDKTNRNKEVSRIENVEEKDVVFYRNLGYGYQDKYPDYLCKRREQVELKGNQFKSKRASFNYFIKHYKSECLPFSSRYKNDCLKLYYRWMKNRKAQNQNPVYQGMLKDNLVCLQVLLDEYRNLGATGRIVKVNGEIKAFTFGFKLNSDIFCVLYETTDLSIKGLAQFIFREFCRELAGYEYINIMDDSGLENLKRVKLSYHPTRLIPAYIINRN